VKMFSKIRVLLGTGIWFLILQQGFACATCFGASDAPMAKGMNMAILTLFGVIVGVLSGILGFVFYLWKRSKIAVSNFQTHSEKGIDD